MFEKPLFGNCDELLISYEEDGVVFDLGGGWVAVD
jgi:hypothetical protein